MDDELIAAMDRVGTSTRDAVFAYLNAFERTVLPALLRYEANGDKKAARRLRRQLKRIEARQEKGD